MTGENTNDELAVLCNQGERDWKPNVIIDCPVLNGGFGNVRLNLLQCIRYAIEARVSLKLPTISRRSASDISDFVTNDQMGLDYLIDDHRMLNRLQKACPELVVHPSHYEDKRIRRLPDISPVLDLHIDSHLPEGLPGDFAVPTAPGQWPPALDKWIESHTEGQPPSAESPVIFGLRAIMFAWPVAYDPPSAVRHYSELVRPRGNVKLLAAAALLQMRDRFGTHVEFRTRNEARVHDKAFLGLHLRVEKDANDYHWLSYEDQIRYLTQRLQGRKGNDTHPRDPDLPDTDRAVIYVASGDKPGIAKLAEDVAPITVVTKNDLLPEDTLDGQMLRNMTWDQQALVDMLILEHSGYFIGVRDSTFSWHLALRRAAAVNWVVGDYPKDCWLDDKKTRRSGCKAMLADNEEWRDDLSALVGNGHVRLEPQVVKTIWP
ncbi:hypothetical protein CTRI78_v003035 [Colletotrichum trifolii]|uniref:Alternative oxidase n=1 Tax=Colletotrichum trifolii TaxID=5466 RepID=A0A4R8RKQ6_COLTR|nr:hypothetical protein CTRI78_v003035 [Colletotrichum trifolii]